MKSGYDKYDGIWGNPYYDKEVASLKSMIFTRRVFSKAPALVAVHASNGWREECEYKGQTFDPKEWQLAANRWDHQHCCICQFSISEGMTYWATADDRRVLCDACHGHYMKNEINRGQ